MAFTVNAKVVLLCGLATLLLTWAAFHDKSSHGDSVSLQGRKRLSDSQVNESTPAFGDDVTDASEDVTEEVVASEEAVEEVSDEPEASEEVVEEVSEEAEASEEVAEEASDEAEDAAQTDFSTETREDSEELRFGQGKEVREMEETSGDGDVGPDSILPEPEYEPDSFEARIQLHNKLAAAKEKSIHACEIKDGCGTVD